ALDKAIEEAGVDENGNQIKSHEVIKLMSMFGLEDLNSVRDWMLVVALPMYLWQGKNWDMNLEHTHDWDYFCTNLTSPSPQKSSSFQVPLLAGGSYTVSSRRKKEEPKTNRYAKLANYANYANYVREHIVKRWCTSNGVSVQYCFDTDNRTFYGDIRLGQVSRLWTYQVCLEWEYFLTAPPAQHPTLISRYLDLPYFSKVCQLAYSFPPSHHPNTTAINQYGNFSLSPSHLLYIDGDQDPWLYATVHSPYAKEYRGGLGEEDGILIPEAWHHCDENGLGNTTEEPPRIRKVHEKEIEVVKAWIAEWHKERREKEKFGGRREEKRLLGDLNRRNIEFWDLASSFCDWVGLLGAKLVTWACPYVRSLVGENFDTLTPGSIAVLGAGGKVVKGLTKLKDLRNVPDLLLAVVNEVSDLSLIVQEIRAIFGQDTIHGTIPPTATSTLTQLLDRAQVVLLELDQIINYRLLLPPNNDDEINVSHSAWLGEERHVLKLQTRLRTIRLDIVAGLATLNLSSALRLEVRLQELGIMTENVQQSQQLCEDHLRQAPRQDAVEQMFAQLRHLQDLQYRTDSTLRGLSNDLITSRELTACSSVNQQSPRGISTVTGPLISDRVTLPRSSNAINIKVKQYRGASCPPRCLCKCHTSKQMRSPQLLDRLIGNLFLGYSHTPIFAPSCDKATCGQLPFCFITITYLFPTWFLHQILSIFFVYTKRDGPALSLRTLRIRSGTDVIFHSAAIGDITRIKSLFAKGEASPFDVMAASESQPTCGSNYLPASRWLSAKRNMRPTIDLAWNKILRGIGDTNALAAFRRMFADDSYLEDQRFTTLHNIVLGLDYRDLRSYLQTCSRPEIDRTDKLGRTALHWAAARADLGAVQNLLAMHADPNIMTSRGHGPLHMAAANGVIEIMNCLIDSGAQADGKDDHYQITPLIYMCTFAMLNSDCLKRLIDSGANVDAQEYRGATALIYASQYNATSAVIILLETHADINKSKFDGETPLHVAVQANSHDTLDILLSHDTNCTLYTERSRSILHEAAGYGDLKTLQILRSARLQGLETTRKDSAGDTPERLANRRTDEPPEWHTAFSDLLASVTEEIPETSQPAESDNSGAAPASTAVRFVIAAMTQLYEEMQQIHQYASQLPRPPNAVLRALLVICVAVAWRLLP
ncbi:MAG: hypothetical protein Q9187_005131, partial [Circinaria calcarea]